MIAHPAMCSASAAKSLLWVEPPAPLGAGGAGNGARVVGAVGLDQLRTPFEVAGLDRPDKGVDDQPRGRPAGLSDLPLANRPRWSRTPCFACFIWSRSGIANSAAIVAASPGEIMPPATAEVTAFVAAAMPDWPFLKRPTARPGGFGESPSGIGISSVQRAGHSRNRLSARFM
jgi:hypothetical protein